MSFENILLAVLSQQSTFILKKISFEKDQIHGVTYFDFMVESETLYFYSYFCDMWSARVDFYCRDFTKI